ncbi:hypothetical protein O2W18_01200 [Modestobacter sp. VKM Ac-2983]|uniref:hypothetical protein n=1 Tax=Modestobacter sp. VKM Ac-2983 TaxID=3004137 RepID=UPI0022ABB555|nr:hypothetical protein [Modestobacter sp. VKM Ac-2983]MCZ2803717.1 hypothetical protein [Modestobacter sp. VKM Ac-2983]
MSTAHLVHEDGSGPLVSDRSTRSLITWTGLATAVLSSTTVLLDAPSWLALLAVLAFVCAGPGAAVMAHLPVSRPSTSWALTNVLSLAAWAIGTAVSAWLNDWSPTLVLLVLAAATTVSCVVALVRGRRVTR